MGTTTALPPIESPTGDLIDRETGEVIGRVGDRLETPPPPVPAPAPPAPAPGPSVPTTPTAPAQEPQGEAGGPEPLVVPAPGPVADVESALARERADDERQAARENAAAEGKKASRYLLAYHVLAEDEMPEIAEKAPTSYKLWLGPPQVSGSKVSDGPSMEPHVIHAHTQRAAKEQALALDVRLAEAADAERLWWACIPVQSWNPTRPGEVPVPVRKRIRV